MRQQELDHDANVLGAFAVLVADRVRDAVEPVTGIRGASGAALTALLAWADGAHIDALASGLRLSHSRAVRVVDTLETDGLAKRRLDPADGRRALVHLTALGRATASQVLNARARVLNDMLQSLSAEERSAMAAAASRVVRDCAHSRSEARAICRYCDVTACGHFAGRCPSTQGADDAESTGRPRP